MSSCTKFEKNIVVGRPPEAVFDFCRHLDNLPTIITDVTSIEPVAPSKFKLGGKSLDGSQHWDAEVEVISEEPALLAWRTTVDSPASAAGSCQFKPNGPKDTIVTISLSVPETTPECSRRMEKQIQMALLELKNILEKEPVTIGE